MIHFKPHPPTYSTILLDSAITQLKENPTANERKGIKMTNHRTGRPIPDPDTVEGVVNIVSEEIDTTPLGEVESAFINSQPPKEISMTFDTTGYTETVNPTPEHEMTKQERDSAASIARGVAKAAKMAAKEEAAQAKLNAKAAKAEAAELAKAEKAASRLEAVQAKNTSTKEARDAAKAERAERIAALDPDGTRKYHGSMLALADRVKQGSYVKGATGQLRSTNELAEVLDAVPVDNVIRLAKIALELEANPYTHLNSGQQSMNLRNRMRGAIKKGTLTIDRVREIIAEHEFATATDWAERAEAKRATRAANATAAKEAKEAKATAKAEAATTAE